MRGDRGLAKLLFPEMEEQEPMDEEPKARGRNADLLQLRNEHISDRMYYFRVIMR